MPKWSNRSSKMVHIVFSLGQWCTIVAYQIPWCSLRPSCLYKLHKLHLLMKYFRRHSKNIMNVLQPSSKRIYISLVTYQENKLIWKAFTYPKVWYHQKFIYLNLKIWHPALMQTSFNVHLIHSVVLYGIYQSHVCNEPGLNMDKYSICTHMHTHAHAYTCIHTHAHTSMCTHAQTDTYVWAHYIPGDQLNTKYLCSSLDQPCTYYTHRIVTADI